MTGKQTKQRFHQGANRDDIKNMVVESTTAVSATQGRADDEGYEVDLEESSSSSKNKVLVRTTVDAAERYKTEDWPKICKLIPRATPLMRNAAAPDIKDIVAMANELCVSTAKKKQQQAVAKQGSSKKNNRHSDDALRLSSGFYLSHLSEQEYTEFMSNAEHFLVLHVDGVLAGFILAYSSELIDDTDPNEEVDVYIRDHIATSPFVLVKQLVVDPRYKRFGYAELLYMEVYARVVHWHADDATPRSVYTEVTAHNNPDLLAFHQGVGYPAREGVTFTPAQNSSPLSYRTEQRLILCNHHVTQSLNALATSFSDKKKKTNHHHYLIRNKEDVSTDASIMLDTRPVYDSSSMIDPHCVGVGICLYWIEPPDPSGTFYADVRIMMKWRQPGIDAIYPHPRTLPEKAARTPIDMGKDAKVMRIPRYAFNDFSTETTQKYAYIDKHDPPDVITMQVVMRGKFIGKALDLHDFPADTQMLEFKFRMWDNDPDDRCRYFRQLYYVDNTAWQLGVKRVVEVPTCSFLATQVQIGVDETAGTSFLTVRIPCVRNTGYYLRTVAVPLFFIASLTLTSIGLDGIAPRIELNTVLLLTNVAYLFVTKDETPRTSHVTKLDLVTYMCFLAPWFLIVLNYVAFRTDMSIILTDNISYGVCGAVIGFVGCMIFFMRTKYVMTIRQNPSLGEFDQKRG